MQQEAPFVPRGAIAFFAALIAVYAVVWAFFEMIMIARA
jgi:hypothetical protein